MQAIFDDQKALAALDSQIEEAQRAADAEAAFEAANGDIQNPWRNSQRRLNDLVSDRRQLSLRIEGQKLSKAYSDRQSLDEELQLVEQERKAADQLLKECSAHPTIKKWNAAGSIARRYGFGHSIFLYQNWILSGKSRRFAPEGILYIEQQGPEALRFSEEEQQIVRKWALAKENSDRALMKWSGVQDRRQKLLRDWPQLKSAG